MVDGYESGGQFNNWYGADKSVENIVHRANTNTLGDRSNLDNMEVTDSIMIALKTLEDLSQSTQVTEEEMSNYRDQVRAAGLATENATQALRACADAVTKIITNSQALLNSPALQRQATSEERATLSDSTDNQWGSLLQINSSILKTLIGISNKLGAPSAGDLKIGKSLDALQAQEKDLNQKDQVADAINTQAVRQTIAAAILRNPTVNKLEKLGSNLIGLGLMKMAGNTKLPSAVRKGAAFAVWLQIPQTLMQILGVTVSQVLSKWLTNSLLPRLLSGLTGLGGNILKGTLSVVTKIPAMVSSFMSTIGPMITAAAPVLVPLAIAALAGMGIFAGIKGAIDHHKKMKENDKKIDSDPRLSGTQKDVKKLKAHSASGAKTGAVAGGFLGAAVGVGVGAAHGAAIGAALGTVVPGLGNAIGGAVGAVIGGIVAGLGLGALFGGLIGAIKPLGSLISRGFNYIGGWVVKSAKWVAEGIIKLIEKAQPVFRIIGQIFELINPFFRLISMVARKLAGSEWFKKLFGGEPTDPNNSDGSGTYANPEKRGWFSGVKDFVAGVLGNKEGITKVSTDKKGQVYLGGKVITSGYGWRVHPTGTGNKMDGKTHFHKGIDIAYKEGENVGAYVGGKVVKVTRGFNGGYGNTVEIQAADGTIYKYHHAQALAKGLKVGQTVQKGQVIMKAGHTGTATGAHVDMEAWHDGKTMNPLEALAKTEQFEAKQKAEREAARKKKAEQEALNSVANPTSKYISNNSFGGLNRKADATGTDAFIRNAMSPTKQAMTLGTA